MAVSQSAGFSERDQALFVSDVARFLSRQLSRLRPSRARAAASPSNDRLSGPDLRALSPALAREEAART